MLIDPLILLQAYSIGVFPMSDDRDAREVYWVEPKFRAILPLERFHLSRSLAKVLRRDQFRVTANRAFGQILARCAAAAPDRPSTWINHAIERAYGDLHARGFAHSIEVWDGEELVGGLYGVALGTAFFGESMVSRRTDASKVALAWLVARMRFAGVTLLDCQFMTDHLATMGADALAAGAGAAAERAFAPLAGLADTGSPLAPSLTVSGPLSGHSIAQLLTHTS